MFNCESWYQLLFQPFQNNCYIYNKINRNNLCNFDIILNILDINCCSHVKLKISSLDSDLDLDLAENVSNTHKNNKNVTSDISEQNENNNNNNKDNNNTNDNGSSVKKCKVTFKLENDNIDDVEDEKIESKTICFEYGLCAPPEPKQDPNEVLDNDFNNDDRDDDISLAQECFFWDSMKIVKKIGKSELSPHLMVNNYNFASFFVLKPKNQQSDALSKHWQQINQNNDPKLNVAWIVQFLREKQKNRYKTNLLEKYNYFRNMMSIDSFLENNGKFASLDYTQWNLYNLHKSRLSMLQNQNSDNNNCGNEQTDQQTQIFEQLDKMFGDSKPISTTVAQLNDKLFTMSHGSPYYAVYPIILPNTNKYTLIAHCMLDNLYSKPSLTNVNLSLLRAAWIASSTEHNSYLRNRTSNAVNTTINLDSRQSDKSKNKMIVEQLEIKENINNKENKDNNKENVNNDGDDNTQMDYMQIWNQFYPNLNDKHKYKQQYTPNHNNHNNNQDTPARTQDINMGVNGNGNGTIATPIDCGSVQSYSQYSQFDSQSQRIQTSRTQTPSNSNGTSSYFGYKTPHSSRAAQMRALKTVSGRRSRQRAIKDFCNKRSRSRSKTSIKEKQNAEGSRNINYNYNNSNNNITPIKIDRYYTENDIISKINDKIDIKTGESYDKLGMKRLETIDITNAMENHNFSLDWRSMRNRSIEAMKDENIARVFDNSGFNNFPFKKIPFWTDDNGNNNDSNNNNNNNNIESIKQQWIKVDPIVAHIDNPRSKIQQSLYVEIPKSKLKSKQQIQRQTMAGGSNKKPENRHVKQKSPRKEKTEEYKQNRRNVWNIIQDLLKKEMNIGANDEKTQLFRQYRDDIFKRIWDVLMKTIDCNQYVKQEEIEFSAIYILRLCCRM